MSGQVFSLPPCRGGLGRGVNNEDGRSNTPPPPTPPRKGEGSERVVFVAGQDTIISLIQYPGVLGAAALARIDDQRTFLQRHARQSARHNGGALAAGEHEGAEIDVARRQSRLGTGR